MHRDAIFGGASKPGEWIVSQNQVGTGSLFVKGLDAQDAGKVGFEGVDSAVVGFRTEDGDPCDDREVRDGLASQILKQEQAPFLGCFVDNDTLHILASDIDGFETASQT